MYERVHNLTVPVIWLKGDTRKQDLLVLHMPHRLLQTPYGVQQAKSLPHDG